MKFFFGIADDCFPVFVLPTCFLYLLFKFVGGCNITVVDGCQHVGVFASASDNNLLALICHVNPRGLLVPKFPWCYLLHTVLFFLCVPKLVHIKRKAIIPEVQAGNLFLCFCNAHYNFRSCFIQPFVSFWRVCCLWDRFFLSALLRLFPVPVRVFRLYFFGSSTRLLYCSR